MTQTTLGDLQESVRDRCSIGSTEFIMWISGPKCP